MSVPRPMIRPCHHCGYQHRFTSDTDDLELCPSCGGELYPIVEITNETAQIFRMDEKGAIVGHGLHIPRELQCEPGYVKLDVRLLNALYSTARAEALVEKTARSSERDSSLHSLKEALIEELKLDVKHK